jgi:hypothetical protein
LAVGAVLLSGAVEVGAHGNKGSVQCTLRWEDTHYLAWHWNMHVEWSNTRRFIWSDTHFLAWSNDIHLVWWNDMSCSTVNVKHASGIVNWHYSNNNVRHTWWDLIGSDTHDVRWSDTHSLWWSDSRKLVWSDTRQIVWRDTHSLWWSDTHTLHGSHGSHWSHWSHCSCSRWF